MKCDDRDELWDTQKYTAFHLFPVYKQVEVYFGNPAQNMFDLFALFQMQFLVVSFFFPGSGGGNNKETGSVVSLYNQLNKLLSLQCR